jgi:hypothetical protein
VLPVLLIILAYVIFGFYYEGNDEYAITLLLKGDWQSQGGAFEIIHIHKIICYLCSSLYKTMPSMPWYGIFLCLFNLIASINIFIIFHQVLSKFFNQYIETLLLVVLYVIVILQHIILINFTRTAIILSGSSLILIFQLFYSNKDYRHKWLLITSLMFMYTLGFMTRPAAAILSPLLIFPFALLTGLVLKKLKSSIYLVLILSLFVIILQFSHTLLMSPGVRDSDKFHAYWSNIAEFDKQKKMLYKNEQDSIKITALNFRFASDREMMNTNFLDTYSTSNIFYYDKIKSKGIKASIIDLFIFFINPYCGLTLLNLFIFGILLISYFKKGKYYLFYYLIPITLYFFLLLSIYIFMKMPDRLFSPLFTIYTICNLLLLQISELNFNFKKILPVFSVLIIISLGYALNLNIRDNIQSKTLNDENMQILETLGNKFSDKTFLITRSSLNIFASIKVLDNINLESNNRIMPIAGWTTIFPSYIRELESICKSKTIYDFFNFIREHPQNFLIISNEGTNGFFVSYFKILYNLDLKFRMINNVPDVMQKRGYYLYIIE